MSNQAEKIGEWQRKNWEKRSWRNDIRQKAENLEKVAEERERMDTKEQTRNGGKGKERSEKGEETAGPAQAARFQSWIRYETCVEYEIFVYKLQTSSWIWVFLGQLTFNFFSDHLETSTVCYI